MQQHPPFAPQSIRHVSGAPWSCPRSFALRLWPTPMAAWWSPDAADEGWYAWAPQLDVSEVRAVAQGVLAGGPCDAVGWDPPLGDLLHLVPERVLGALGEEIPPGLWWACLRALGAMPELVDLFPTDSVLASLLVTNSLRGSEAMCWAELCRLAGSRRRDLLPLLGLPSDPWILSALRRMHGSVVAAPGAAVIRRALIVPDRRLRKTLQHLAPIIPEVLRILGDPLTAALATPALLHDAGPPGLHDALRAIALYREQWLIPAHPRTFRSRARVEQVLGDLRHGVDVVLEPTRYPGTWEVPVGAMSFLGSQPITFTPVTSAEGMLEHGERLQNCLAWSAEYAAACAAGAAALFEASWVIPGVPEAGDQLASVLLRKSEHGWVLDELGLPGGRVAPRGRLRQTVEDWAWLVSAHADERDLLRRVARFVESHTEWQLQDEGLAAVHFSQGCRRAAVRLLWCFEGLRRCDVTQVVRQLRYQDGLPVQVAILIPMGDVDEGAVQAIEARTRPAVLLVMPGLEGRIAVESRRVRDEDRALAVAVGDAFQ
jgi:hypothetical protein